MQDASDFEFIASRPVDVEQVRRAFEAGFKGPKRSPWKGRMLLAMILSTLAGVIMTIALWWIITHVSISLV